MRRFPAFSSIVAATTLALGAAAYASPLDPDTGRVYSPPTLVRSAQIPYATQQMLRPYSGLGTWADVYDWSRTFGGGRVNLRTIDQMAAAGVQTLFIQTTKYKEPGNVLEPARLKALIYRAHQRGMDVVGWYLPNHLDEQRDFRKLNAMLALGVDGITVDIESTANKDVPARNAALIRLMRRLSIAVERSGQPIAVGAATYTPHTLDHSVRMWPNFPWQELSPYVHVWLPMSYWSQFIRSKSGMGHATVFTADTITRLRAHLGPDANIHVIGGSGMDPTQVSRMINQMRAMANPPIGGSLYDWRVTSVTSRRVMRPLTALRITVSPTATGVSSSGNATVMRGASGSAEVVWWSPDSSTIRKVDVGGLVTTQPSIAFVSTTDGAYMVAARIKKLPNRDDWRTEYPAYIRMDAGAATGTWRELTGAPRGCKPALARIPRNRMMAVCADPRGVVSFAYLPDRSSHWSRWFSLSGTPALPANAQISVATAGSTAAVSWVDAQARVKIATWTIGTRKSKVSDVLDAQSNPITAISGAAMLNPISSNALSLTFATNTGAYRVPISVDGGLTLGKPDAPTIPGKRQTVLASLEFGDSGFAFVDAADGGPTWIQP